MDKSTGLRPIVGFVAAWAASVAMGFVLVCLYAVRLNAGHIIEFLAAMTTGSKDAWGVLLYVGIIVAVVAAAIAFGATVFIAVPLYLELPPFPWTPA